MRAAEKDSSGEEMRMPEAGRGILLQAADLRLACGQYVCIWS